MSAHEVDLYSLKHTCFSLACIISLGSVFLFLFSISFFVLPILWYGTDPACLRTSHLHFLFDANHL